MKKNLMIFLAFLFFYSFTSCKKESDGSGNLIVAVDNYTSNYKVFTVKVDGENMGSLSLFPNRMATAGAMCGEDWVTISKYDNVGVYTSIDAGKHTLELVEHGKTHVALKTEFTISGGCGRVATQLK